MFTHHTHIRLLTAVVVKAKDEERHVAWTEKEKEKVRAL